MFSIRPRALNARLLVMLPDDRCAGARNDRHGFCGLVIAQEFSRACTPEPVCTRHGQRPQNETHIRVSVWLATALIAVLPVCAQTASGPLRVLSANPRYFADGSGKAVYLAGSHNWNNFEDTGHRRLPQTDPPAVFDYTAYLDFLQAHHHNFFRLWRWESPKWTDDEPAGVGYSRPHPWLRSGPGLAADGKPKFDLTRFDPE